MFEGYNSLVKACCEAGLSQTVYNCALYFAFAVQLVFLIIYRKKYNLSLKNSLLTLLIIYPCLYFWMLFITWAELGFENWGAKSIMRLYVWVPLIAVLPARILRLPPKTLADYLAPSMAIEQVIVPLACPFAGCCCGFPCEWGIYNAVFMHNCFPAQWVDVFFSLLIFLFLLKYAQKEGYTGSGKVYAKSMVVFGIFKFFLELIRDNEKLFWKVSELGIHCVFLALVGVYWLIDINEREKKKAKSAGIPKRSKAR